MASIKKVTTRDGHRYQIRWRDNGRAIEKWEPTLERARAVKARAEGAAVDGLRYDPQRGAKKLDDYFDAWLPARLVKGRPLTPSTRVGYRRLWDRTIKSTIGRRQLRAIAPETVREWHGELATATSTDQAAKAYRLLRAVLATAEADELIAANPCRIRGGGQENATERPMVATSLVLDLADRIDKRYRAVVLIAGLAGLRSGESLGLLRRDVDVLHGEIHVERQAQEVGGRIVVAPKSEAGTRVVVIPKDLTAALSEHLAAFVAAGADAPVFTEPSGKPLRRATLSAAWRAAVTAADAPKGLRLHDLRHHALTVAARMPGVTTKELMARAGHASPRAALIYQHATAERDRAIAAFLDTELAAVERPALAPVVDLAQSTRGVGAGLAGDTESSEAV